MVKSQYHATLMSRPNGKPSDGFTLHVRNPDETTSYEIVVEGDYGVVHELEPCRNGAIIDYRKSREFGTFEGKRRVRIVSQTHLEQLRVLTDSFEDSEVGGAHYGKKVVPADSEIEKGLEAILGLVA